MDTSVHSLLRRQVPLFGNAVTSINRDCVKSLRNRLKLRKETGGERDPQKRSAGLKLNGHIAIFRNRAPAKAFSNELGRVILRPASLPRWRIVTTRAVGARVADSSVAPTFAWLSLPSQVLVGEG